MLSIDKNLDYKAPDGRQMAALLMGHFKAFDVIEQDSRNVLTPDFFIREFPNGIDLATVDGDHSYGGCSFDLEAIAPSITARGIMIVDDYYSGPPNGIEFESVTNSVNHFLERHPAAYHAEVWNKKGKGLCVIKRITDSWSGW
jgi:hypothetical protein